MGTTCSNQILTCSCLSKYFQADCCHWACWPITQNHPHIWCEQPIWSLARQIHQRMHGQGAPSCHSFDGLKECQDRASREHLLIVFKVSVDWMKFMRNMLCMGMTGLKVMSHNWGPSISHPGQVNHRYRATCGKQFKDKSSRHAISQNLRVENPCQHEAHTEFKYPGKTRYAYQPSHRMHLQAGIKNEFGFWWHILDQSNFTIFNVLALKCNHVVFT